MQQDTKNMSALEYAAEKTARKAREGGAVRPGFFPSSELTDLLGEEVTGFGGRLVDISGEVEPEEYDFLEEVEVPEGFEHPEGAEAAYEITDEIDDALEYSIDFHEAIIENGAPYDGIFDVYREESNSVYEFLDREVWQ